MQTLNGELIETISTAIRIQDEEEAEWVAREEQRRKLENEKIAKLQLELEKQPYVVPKDAFKIVSKKKNKGKQKIIAAETRNEPTE